jgi:hypothetical protein
MKTEGYLLGIVAAVAFVGVAVLLMNGGDVDLTGQAFKMQKATTYETAKTINTEVAEAPDTRKTAITDEGITSVKMYGTTSSNDQEEDGPGDDSGIDPETMIKCNNELNECYEYADSLYTFCVKKANTWLENCQDVAGNDINAYQECGNIAYEKTEVCSSEQERRWKNCETAHQDCLSR